MNKVEAMWRAFCAKTDMNVDTPYQSWCFSESSGRIGEPRAFREKTGDGEFCRDERD